MTILLTIVFILSGAAGLMYESIWSRYLGLFVGHSAYAQVIVLVIFLGGMSAGAAIASRRSARLREPLLWYAGIELVVGVLGLGFHAVYVAVTNAAYETVFPALAGGTLLVVVKWTIAAVLILPQSILLGATFPLMSAGLIRRLKRDPAGPDGSGRVLGLLYFANSLGAAGGVLVAGFWTIRVLGLPGTLIAAAVVNLVVALAVFAAVKMERDAAEEDGDEVLAAPSAAAEDPLTIPPGSATLWRLLLAVSFGTAVASLTERDTSRGLLTHPAPSRPAGGSSTTKPFSSYLTAAPGSFSETVLGTTPAARMTRSNSASSFFPASISSTWSTGLSPPFCVILGTLPLTNLIWSSPSRS